MMNVSHEERPTIDHNEERIVSGEEGNVVDLATQRYEFKPLNGPNNIRVLKLHAVTDDTIECSLEEISYMQRGYDALSYVWGSPQKPHRALVRDEYGSHQGFIPLTSNLWDALHDLWAADELDRKIFWIDQICINQEGEEKNDQVKLMGFIYAGADQVITYLGRSGPQDEEERGITLLYRVFEHFSPIFDHLADGLAFQLGSIPDPTMNKLPDDLQDKTYEDWRWLIAIGFGEWATRLWIVQEQVINSRNVMLRGSKVLPWEAVALIPILLRMNILPEHNVWRFWSEHRGDFADSPAGIAASLWSIWQSRQLQKLRDEAILTGSQLALPPRRLVRSLAANLVWYEKLGCFDPRDRIYALLMISDDGWSLNISPDYSCSVVDVYHQTSKAILEKAPHLSFLAYVCRWDNSDFSRPSWILNARRPPGRGANNIPFGLSTAHPLRRLVSPLQFQHENGRTLVVKGRVVDEIAYITPPLYLGRSFSRNNIDEEWIQTVSQFLSSWTEVLRHQGNTVASAAALCRAIVANPSWASTLSLSSAAPGWTVEHETALHFQAYFRYWLGYLKANATQLGLDIGEKLACYDRTLLDLHAAFGAFTDSKPMSPDEPLSPDEDKMSDEVYLHQILEGRTYCVTSQGRICSGMNEVQIGDAVAAFQGADRLFILRPLSTGFRLFSDAYLDRLMEGEAYDGLNPEVVDVDIELM